MPDLVNLHTLAPNQVLAFKKKGHCVVMNIAG
jgi:hypothetical protein